MQHIVFSLTLILFSLSLNGMIIIRPPKPPRKPDSFHDTIAQTLLDDPLSALQEIIRIQHVFNKYLHTSRCSTIDFIKKHERINPLFFLGESTDPSSRYNREHNPLLRETFENQATNLLSTQIMLQQGLIHYTSYESGRLFSDIVILTKTLSQHPHASIHVHCIDACYQEYLSHKKNHTVTIDENNATIISIFNVQIMFKQCLQWLKKRFPNATVSLSVYSSNDNYKNHLQQNNIEYPDVLVTADPANPDGFIELATLSAHYKAASKNSMLYHPLNSEYLTFASLKPDIPNQTVEQIVQTNIPLEPLVYLYCESIITLSQQEKLTL